MRFLKTFIVLLCLSVSSWATDYYVATTGSDSNVGDITHPFLTIAHADSVAVAGDTVHVASGTYNTVNTSHSGASGSRITFISDTLLGAKIVPSTGPAAWNSSGAWVDIIGFDITAPSLCCGILSSASHLRVMNSYIHDISTSACISGGAFDTANYTSNDQEIIGNLIARVGPSSGTVFCSNIHGIYLPTASNIAQNNIVVQIGGWGIHLWHAATGGIITNNTVINAQDGGIMNGSGDSNCSVNTGSVVNNNLVVGTRVGIAEGVTTGCSVVSPTYSHNMFYLSTVANYGSPLSATPSGTVTGDPKFVTYNTSGTGNYHVQSTSPAIDAGTSSNAPSTDYDGTSRPQNSLYDIGAYEYAGSGGTTFTSTTTYAAEVANNTSGKLTTCLPNGVPCNINVSKEDVHKLLYSGATTFVAPNMLNWFCMDGTGTKCQSHIKVGYNSNDTTQMVNSVNDMMARGINGIFPTWYGKPYGTATAACPQGTSNCIKDQALQKIFTYADSLCSGGSCPFKVGIMVDHGSFRWFCNLDNPTTLPSHSTAQACVISKMESDINWVNSTFWGNQSLYKNPATGHNIYAFFLPEDDANYKAVALDWATILGTLHTYANSLSHAPIDFMAYGTTSHLWDISVGAFSWVKNTSDGSFPDAYYTWFYKNSTTTWSSKQMWGSNFAQFNDVVADWSPSSGPRIVKPHCGQTWIKSSAYPFTLGLYSSAHQLGVMQIVTWNDYDEGTAMEPGVENCMSVSASASGSTLNWTIAATDSTGDGGNQNTLDHFKVFIGDNQSNLAVLQDNISAGTRTLNIGSYGLASTHTYYLYVKAIGKSSVRNHMSNVVQLQCVSGSCNQVAANNPVPTLTAVVPATLSVGSSTTTVDVVGSGFVSGAQGKIGGSNRSTTFVSSSDVQVTIPSSDLTTAGTLPLTVTNPTPGGGTSNAINIFVGTAPPGGGGGGGTGGTASPVVTIVSATPTSGDVPQTVTLNSSTTDADNDLVSVSINWGDSTTSPTSAGTHIYSTAGTYNIVVTATDSQGHTGTTSQSVTFTAPTYTNLIVLNNLVTGANVYTPTRVYGTATAASGTISTLSIIVDGVTVYTSTPGTASTPIDKYVFLRKGRDHIIRVSVTTSGAVTYFQEVTVHCIDYLH